MLWNIGDLNEIWWKKYIYIRKCSTRSNLRILFAHQWWVMYPIDGYWLACLRSVPPLVQPQYPLTHSSQSARSSLLTVKLFYIRRRFFFLCCRSFSLSLSSTLCFANVENCSIPNCPSNFFHLIQAVIIPIKYDFDLIFKCQIAIRMHC